MIFDTHCHLNHADLYKDIDRIIESAHNVGVNKMLVVGYDKQTSFLAVEIANRYEGIYAAVGFHPTEIYGVSEEDYNQTLELIKNEKVVAIGEIGLDYHWVKDEEQRKLQKEYFIKQIEFANEYQLPICIHCRDALNDTLEILKLNKPLYGGVMHCYSGSVEMMKSFIDLGLYISLGGPVTFKNAKTPKEVAEEIDLNKLLVETDSPYLAPHPLRGSTNKPEYIRYVVDEIANLRSISKKHIAEVTYKNACKIFKINE